ncbi:MAG: hypothetical protein EXR67_05940 [Dehalococcoidia bacterium]|nr:hypothetical protein [Dehalococcoidia bacterium]
MSQDDQMNDPVLRAAVLAAVEAFLVDEVTPTVERPALLWRSLVVRHPVKGPSSWRGVGQARPAFSVAKR